MEDLIIGKAEHRACESYRVWEGIENKETPEARQHSDQWQSYRSAERQLVRSLEAMGELYNGCTFQNFEPSDKQQLQAVKDLRDYAQNAECNIADGLNVILYGPCGTGKDHLLTALAKAVLQETGVATCWKNGFELTDMIQNASFEGDWNRLKPIIEADILYVSDPLPPTGALSESKQAGWFRIIDSRYRARKPTWLSMNVANSEEAEERMGVAVVDRLRDKSLTIRTFWESHRKV